MENFFLNAAIGFTVVFLIQLFLLFFGGTDDAGFDSEEGAEGTFKIVTIQSFVVLLMMGSWSGTFFLKQDHTYAILFAALTGLVSMYGYAWLISKVTAMDTPALKPLKFNNGLPQVGAIGSTYQPIPQGCYGTVMIGGRDLTAFNSGTEDLESFETIYVTGIDSNGLCIALSANQTKN